MATGMLNVLSSICRGISHPGRAQRGLFANKGILSGNTVGTSKLHPRK